MHRPIEHLIQTLLDESSSELIKGTENKNQNPLQRTCNGSKQKQITATELLPQGKK